MRYFHGGVRDLEVGDLVLPADETGAEGVHRLLLDSDAVYRKALSEQPQLYRPDRVYLTDGPRAAGRASGFSALLPVDPRRGGDLYEVEPIGDVEDDEIADVVQLPSSRDWCRAPRARVIDVVGERARRMYLTHPIRPDRPWFHGGPPGLLEPGDLILPAATTGRAASHQVRTPLFGAVGVPFYRPDRVYLTQSFDWAMRYAQLHPSGDFERGGDIFQVEPLGPVEAGSIYVKPDAHTICVGSARILKVYRHNVRRRWMDQASRRTIREWQAAANLVREQHGMPLL